MPETGDSRGKPFDPRRSLLMARIRSIKPEFWDSPDTIRASLRARLLYIAMWNWADDYGIGDGNLNRLISFAFPGDDVPASDFPTLASEVSDCFAVVFYEHGGRPYYYLPTWENHQRTEKKARQHVPYPADAKPTSDRDREPSAVSVGFSDASVGSTVPGTRGTRETGEQGEQGGARKRATRIPDDFALTDPMRAWAAERTPAVDVDLSTERFINHWRAKSGRDATKLDWLATWKNWLLKDQESAPQRPRAVGTARESSLARRDQQFLDTDNELARREATRNGRTGSEPLALPAFGVRPA